MKKRELIILDSKQDFTQNIIEILKTNKISIKPKPITPDVISKNKIYSELKDAKKQYDANGLQHSLSNGLQAPGTFVPVKGLFNQ